MKRSELKKLISEVVRRKLNEADGKRIASVVNKILSNESIDDIQVLTHYGSHRLEIMEVYQDNGVLYLTVNANPLNEVDATGDVLGQPSQQTSSDSKSTDSMEKVDPKTQADIDATQKELDKVTASIRKLDGEKTKLEDPVRRKIQDLDRKKALLQKKQGNTTKKLEDLKDK